jgi:hypothetical protein
LEGSGDGVIEVLSRHWPGGTEENHIINITLYRNYKILNELYFVGVTTSNQCFKKKHF